MGGTHESGIAVRKVLRGYAGVSPGVQLRWGGCPRITTCRPMPSRNKRAPCVPRLVVSSYFGAVASDSARNNCRDMADVIMRVKSFMNCSHLTV